jgi:DNA-binding GntR family transcriptional regulator
MARKSTISKVDAVVQHLRGQIRAGEIRPGERLLQELLAERLGVSATPIREALRLLAAEGLVEYVPFRGVSVREVHESELFHISEVRARIEGYAAGLAARELDHTGIAVLRQLHDELVQLNTERDFETFALVSEEWHLAINRATGIAILPEVAGRLWAVVPADTASAIPGRPDATLVEHAAILEAFERRDSEAAETAMVDHIRSAARFVSTFRAHDKAALDDRPLSG